MKLEKSQQIELTGLQEWLNDKSTRLTYARQLGKINKTLQVNAFGGYVVVLNGEDVFETTQPSDAVKKYNEI